MMRKLLPLFFIYSIVINSYSQAPAVRRGITELISLFKSKPKVPTRVYPKIPPKPKLNQFGLPIDNTLTNSSSYKFYESFYRKQASLYNHSPTYSNADFKRRKLEREIEKAFGKKLISQEERLIFSKNREAIDIVEKAFGEKIFRSIWVEDEVYNKIWNYQKKNKIPLLKFGIKESKRLQITLEGVENFIIEYEKLSLRFRVYRKLFKKFNLGDDLLYLEKQLEQKWASLKGNSMKRYPWRNVQIPTKGFDLDIDNLNFKKLNEVIDSNMESIVNKVGKLESNLHKMGYLDSSVEELSILKEVDIYKEVDFISKRLETSTNLFKKDFSISNETNNEMLSNILNMEIEKQNSLLGKIIDSNESKLEHRLKEYFKIHEDIRLDDFIINKKIREKIAHDISEKNYYVKINNDYKKYKNERIEIKNNSDSIKIRNVIKLYDKANVYLEKTINLPEDIFTLSSSLNKKLETEDVKTIFLSKYKKRSSQKKDVVIDCLSTIFPKKAISFILNKSTNSIKKELKREFRKNKGKKLFFIGHIENGAFVSKQNSNYKIPLSYIKKMSNDYGTGYFIGGCSSSYYNVSAGTTDLINDLNFGLAIAESFSKSTTYKEFITTISKQKINGGLGEVKFILKADTFSPNNKGKIEVYIKKNGIWKKIVDFFFKCFKAT